MANAQKSCEPVMADAGADGDCEHGQPMFGSCAQCNRVDDDDQFCGVAFQERVPHDY